ncbi:MAG: D-lyxose/D-mannose family sugar isomerase [Planctomycetota bacterium]
MKRSQINTYLRDAITFIRTCGFHLPPFAFWTVARWRAQGAKAAAVRRAGLGWDITDFGSGDFKRLGGLLFTIRNGVKGSGRTYAEKLMVVGENQVTPMHFHHEKTEDIINRGGGILMVRLYNADKKDGLARTRVRVAVDGTTRTIAAGGLIKLTPGESITMTPRLYHTFCAAAGRGTVLVGEVSTVNDDTNDNRFLKPMGRFPRIEEDEPPLYPLCFETQS